MLSKEKVDRQIRDKLEELNQQQISISQFRQFVVDLLEQFRNAVNVKDLCSWLENHKDGVVRAVAAECLEKIADPSTIDVISRAAKNDSCFEVREICAKVASIIPNRSQAREKFNQACDLLWNLKVDEAISLFQETISIEHEGPYAGLFRGLIFYAQDRFENALREFDAVSADWPWLSDTFIHLGLTYRQLGVKDKTNSLPYFESSITCFEKAVELEPLSSFAYIGMARTYLKIEGSPQLKDKEEERKKALRRADECIEKVLDLDPENPAALIGKANILSKKADYEGDFEKSKKLTEEIDDLVEKVLLSERADISTLSYAWGFKAKKALKAKPPKFKDAEEFCLKAFRLGGKDTDRFIFMLMQDAQKNQGKTEEAINTCRTWCTLYSDDPWAYANLARRLEKGGNIDEALAHYKKAAELGNDDGKLMSFVSPYLANILYEKGEPFQAEYILEKAPEKTFKNYGTQELKRKIKAEILTRREKSNRVCIEVEEKLRSLREESPQYENELNSFHVQLTKESESDPYNPRIWTDLGRIENERGKFSNAIKFCERAFELINPNDSFGQAIVGLNYGIALKNTGEIDEAVNQLQEAFSRASGQVKQVIKIELKDAKRKQKTKAIKVRESVRFHNNYTGVTEVHNIDDLKDFVKTLSKELPIGEKLNEIADEPVFLRAATGVGKTVTIPMHLFLKMWDKRPRNKTPQIFVVEPRIPIAVDEMRHMNEIYQDFLLQKEAITILSSHTSIAKEEVSKKIRTVFRIPYDSIETFSDAIHQQLSSPRVSEELIEKVYRIYQRKGNINSNQGPFGSITSLGAINHNALVVFVTTGIFEKRAFEDDFDVKLVDCSEQRFEIEYRNCKGKLEDVVLSLIETYLIKRENISEKLREWDRKESPKNRSIGMLVVVNSHLSEHSDTLKFQNKIRSKPEFKNIEVLRLASPVIRDPIQRQEFKERINAIEQRNGRYVIIATNVVEMGITYPSLDFVVTMDTEYMNVIRETGITLELMPLGLNALKQRAGRCGRKRPGMCFITKDYNEGKGAWYTNLSDEKLNELNPEPIKYPLIDANLQKLAILSFMEEVEDRSLIYWLKSLRLPSHLENSSDRIQHLKDEREKLRQKGLADEIHLTQLGKEVLKYVGIEDIDFARMAALCDNKEVRPIIIAISALSEFSLDDFLHQHTPLPEDKIAKLSLTEKLGPIDAFSTSPEQIMEILNSEESFEALKKRLQEIGIEAYYLSEILSLVKDGYRPRSLEEVVGLKPDISEFDNNREDYEKAYENWKNSVSVNKNYIHLQKEVITLDPNSELIALYDIVSYFFNKYYYLFTDKLPLYIYQKAEMAFKKEADDLGLKKHTLKNAIEAVIELFDYLDEKIPLRKEEVKPELKPSPDELKDLLNYYVSILCKEQEITTSKLAFRLALRLYDPVYGKRRLNPNDNVLKGMANDFNTTKEILAMLFRRVCEPAWKRFYEEWKSLHFVEYHHFLPRLRPDTRKKVFEDIVKCSYGQKWILKRGGFGYISNIDWNGRKLHLELNSSRTSIILQGDKVQVLGKTRPGIRPDGIEFLTLTHVTYIGR